MKVEKIKLLSVKEYRKYRKRIQPINDCWWLRTRGQTLGVSSDLETAYVTRYGDFNDAGESVYFQLGVRPALMVRAKHGEQISSPFTFGGKQWSMISDKLALADEPLCKMAFYEDWCPRLGNNYQKSDVKRYLDKWFSDAMQLSKRRADDVR